MALERLHKYLAHCGVASRRKAEEIIQQGRVTVNGQVIDELGVKIEPNTDRVMVDGKTVHPEGKIYILLHKPKGYTTTAEDEFGRKTVLDLLDSSIRERVYPAGRLDRESEGLVVLTNDGDLSYFLTHPSKGVKKVYEAVVEGVLEESKVKEIVEKGVRLGPTLIKPLMCKVVSRRKTSTAVKIAVAEGVNREVRRLFAAIGHEVKKLIRLDIGPLSLSGISKGKYRKFKRQELELLQEWMAKGGSEAAAKIATKLRGRRGVHNNKGNRPAGKPDPASRIKSKNDNKKAGSKPTIRNTKKKVSAKKKKVTSPAKSHPLFKK